MSDEPQQSTPQQRDSYSIKRVRNRVFVVFGFAPVAGSASNPDPFNCQSLIAKAGFLCILKRDTASIALMPPAPSTNNGSGGSSSSSNSSSTKSAQFKSVSSIKSKLNFRGARLTPQWINCEPNSLRGAARALSPEDFIKLVEDALKAALTEQEVIAQERGG